MFLLIQPSYKGGFPYRGGECHGTDDLEKMLYLYNIYYFCHPVTKARISLIGKGERSPHRQFGFEPHQPHIFICLLLFFIIIISM